MPAIRSVNLSNEAATLDLGRRLACVLVAGDFVALRGDLGAGKTTLARGLVRSFMGEDVDVPSPTFTLVQTYFRPIAAGEDRYVTQTSLDLYHFDLYRLKSSEEVWELGWEDIAAGVALVEWPDRAVEFLPETRLELTLSFEGEGRIAQLSSPRVEYWKDRLDGV